MDYQRLNLLYQKYCTNSLNPEEFEEFIQLIEDVDEEYLLSLSAENIENDSDRDFAHDNVFNRIANQIDDLEKQKKDLFNRKTRTLYYKAAASIAVLFVFSYFLYTYHDKYKDNHETEEVYKLISNNNSPTITNDNSNIEFADGKTLDLDFLPNDSIYYKGISIVRAGENDLIINKEAGLVDFDMHTFHMFAAKKGSTLKLTLPDNSIVQLNSGSSIKISSSYGINNRNVMLKGEGYFEVAHNKQIPFVVEVKDAKINVLGTNFNLSGYDQDNHVKATLISGSIAVNTISDKTVIKPGQQAIVNNQSTIHINNNVNLAQILAWREGVFRFQDESIEFIMSELSKWYNINDVQISNSIKDKFTGSIKRTKQLKDVLNALEEVSDLQFVIEEGRVMVTK
ncbi:FecR family protein [Sphingobacterium composti Ten et al. 2007 non Yoo et al. 2007]|uniref:FecR family protein n=1 Tax=Sphingobacterium composti TaxID=363260 RepID=UPI001358DC8F|nr:FecR family protein [Sphingobacterium composti Ten et al. 2007 non Yoo et al. 2007]